MSKEFTSRITRRPKKMVLSDPINFSIATERTTSWKETASSSVAGAGSAELLKGCCFRIFRTLPRNSANKGLFLRRRIVDALLLFFVIVKVVRQCICSYNIRSGASLTFLAGFFFFVPI
jgi:hypothetical protein